MITSLDGLIEALADLRRRVPGSGNATVFVVVRKSFYTHEDEEGELDEVEVDSDVISRIDYEHGRVMLSSEE